MMKVLIVDDSKLIRHILSDAIKEKYPDAELYEARKPYEALDTFRHINPDLVFMDIMLNDKDDRSGIDITREIKTLKGNTKVIICSSLADQQTIHADCINVGADACISKPFTSDGIINIVKKIIGDIA
jgi:two-component system, chemotaxis family, chemotaxis protein CheY